MLHWGNWFYRELTLVAALLLLWLRRLLRGNRNGLGLDWSAAELDARHGWLLSLLVVLLFLLLLLLLLLRDQLHFFVQVLAL